MDADQESGGMTEGLGADPAGGRTTTGNHPGGEARLTSQPASRMRSCAGRLVFGDLVELVGAATQSLRSLTPTSARLPLSVLLGSRASSHLDKLVTSARMLPSLVSCFLS